jgi:hypothetical protein
MHHFRQIVQDANKKAKIVVGNSNVAGPFLEDNSNHDSSIRPQRRTIATQNSVNESVAHESDLWSL